MPQFAIHKNRNEATKTRFPLLLVVQADFLELLNTRVVVPLTIATLAKSHKMEMLTPTLVVAGKSYVMVTPQLASVSVRELGAILETLSSERDAIISSLDLLITGI